MIIQAITLSLAAVGAVLGIINTWHGLDKTRVKLKVRPAHVIPIGGADPNLRFSIEVTNLSAFAVTVSEVGLLYHRTDTRGALVRPILADNGPWPRRLEPRSSITIYAAQPQSPPNNPIRCAYAKTECGIIKTGSSPALKQISKGGRNFRATIP